MTSLYTHLFDTRRRIYETASSKLLAGKIYPSIEVNVEQSAADTNEAWAQRTTHRDCACLLRGTNWIIISPIFSSTIRAASRTECILYTMVKVKVKLTLEEATKDQKGLQVQLYSFLNFGARWRWVVNATPRPLYSRERPGTYCIGGWVGPRAGVDGYGKSRPHRNSIPGPPSP